MARRRKTFIFHDDGAPRCILKMEEVEEKGELTIVLRHTARAKAGDAAINTKSNDPEHGHRIKETHISVHPSLNSPRINTIHIRRTLANGSSHSEIHYTHAIKRAIARFAPVVFFRLSNLNDEQYRMPKKKGQLVDLGATDSNFFVPFIGVFVGRAGIKVGSLASRLPFQLRVIRLQNYSLLLFWTFFIYPAPAMSCFTFVKRNVVAEAGKTLASCFIEFREHIGILRHDLIVAEKLEQDSCLDIDRLKISNAFFNTDIWTRTASKGSIEFRAWY